MNAKFFAVKINILVNINHTVRYDFNFLTVCIDICNHNTCIFDFNSSFFADFFACICKEFTFFTPRFTLECSDWEVNGSFMEWDYTIDSPSRGCIATITKEFFHWTDTYVIDVADPKDALGALMVVLAIDAEKCSRNN